MNRTRIEWADITWNPLLGCERVSTGCDNCYAIQTAHIRSANPNAKVAGAFAGLTDRVAGRIDWTGQINLLEDRLSQPLTWHKPQKVFVNSQSDLFHKDVPDSYIARVWQMMGAANQHTYQILTKRHGRMRSWLTRWYAGDIPEPCEVRPVPGYPGYSVSTLGQVFGKRADTRGGLSQDPGQSGHLKVTMHRAGSPRTGDRELVHRLVLSAFVRLPRPGEQACHRNGDPSDNRLSNLYWGTQEKNWSDRLRHGNGRSYAKITDRQAADIRTRCASGESSVSVAKDFPIGPTQVRNIASGRQWVNPEPDPVIAPPARAVLDCVWIGVSVEDQHTADMRIPSLLDTPAAVRWLSMEPLLGPVDLSQHLSGTNDDRRGAVSWAVIGGESGVKAREMHPQWALDLLGQCMAAGVPSFFKQTGTRLAQHLGLAGKGDDWDTLPDHFKIRQFPLEGASR